MYILNPVNFWTPQVQAPILNNMCVMWDFDDWELWSNIEVWRHDFQIGIRFCRFVFNLLFAFIWCVILTSQKRIDRAYVNFTDRPRITFWVAAALDLAVMYTSPIYSYHNTNHKFIRLTNHIVWYLDITSIRTPNLGIS